MGLQFGKETTAVAQLIGVSRPSEHAQLQSLAPGQPPASEGAAAPSGTEAKVKRVAPPPPPPGLARPGPAVWRDGSRLPLPTRLARSQLLQRTRAETSMPISLSASPSSQRRLPIFSELTS